MISSVLFIYSYITSCPLNWLSRDSQTPECILHTTPLMQCTINTYKREDTQHASSYFKNQSPSTTLSSIIPRDGFISRIKRVNHHCELRRWCSGKNKRLLKKVNRSNSTPHMSSVCALFKVLQRGRRSGRGCWIETFDPPSGRRYDDFAWIHGHGACGRH